jgi:hypothetical protein
VPHKLSLFLAHDSTIEPLLQVFRAVEGKTWPPYASTVIFELYEPSESGGDHKVRVLSNGKPLPMVQLVSRAKSLRSVRLRARADVARVRKGGNAADVYTVGDLPIVRPAGGWTHGGAASDADCVITLGDLNLLLSPLALSEEEYWTRCETD